MKVQSNRVLRVSPKRNHKTLLDVVLTHRSVPRPVDSEALMAWPYDSGNWFCQLPNERHRGLSAPSCSQWLWGNVRERSRRSESRCPHPSGRSEALYDLSNTSTLKNLGTLLWHSNVSAPSARKIYFFNEKSSKTFWSIIFSERFFFKNY